MKKSKWLVMSCILGTGLLISTNVFAKASAIIVKGTDGKIYQYDYAGLKASAVASVTGDTTGAKLYEDFLSRKSSIKAYYDDVQKGYVDFSTVSQAASDSVIKGNTFDFDTFLQTATTEILSPTKISSDNNGNISTDNGQTTDTTLGIDMSSVQCSNPVDNYSTIVTFKLNIPSGDNVTNYDVTVKGTKATYSTVKGLFVVTVSGKITSSDLTTSDFVISKKSNNPTDTVTISNINDISATVNQGDNYSLPNAVIAIMSDGSKKYVAVTWDKSVDTSKGGTYTFNGTVSGYNGSIVLTLTINPSSQQTVKYFPLMSDVPQPSVNYIKYETYDDNTIVYYYYNPLNLSSTFVSDYVKLLKSNGWTYYKSTNASDGSIMLFYRKGTNLITLTTIGNYAVIGGNIH